MELKHLKSLYEMYYTYKDKREYILGEIKKLLALIHKCSEYNIDNIEPDRNNNKIKYKKDNEELQFYFYGNEYYINGLKLIL